MSDYLWMAGKAFLISLILTPIFRDLFRSYNVVDRPGFRKVHRHPIPRIGGIPIAIAYTVALLSVPSVSKELLRQDSVTWKLLPGVVLIFLTGLLDDFFDLSPRFKLLGQIAAAAVVFASGLRITELGGIAIPLWISFPMTVFWLLLTTNALNLIDGLDGLCAGMGLLATLTLFSGSLIQSNPGLSHATLPLAGALLGFLWYNFNPASVFLGDSGALMIGFLLGCYGMIWTQKTTTLLSVAVPLLSITIPLADVSLSIFRRFLNNRPIFSADRGHIHHRLLDRGLSTRGTALVLYSMASLTAMLALLVSVPELSRFHVFFLLALIILVWAGVRQLRYLEFAVVGRALFSGELQRSMARKTGLERLSHTLHGARTEEDWWSSIVQAADEAGWYRIRLELYEQADYGRPDYGQVKEAVLKHSGDPGWHFQASLGDAGRIILEGAAVGQSAAHRVDLLGFAEVVNRSLVRARQARKLAVPTT